MKSRPRKLVARLIYAFLLPSLIILGLLATLVYLRVRTALRDSIFERLSAIATVKESTLDTWVQHQFHDLVLFSELPSLAGLAAGLLDTDEEVRQTAHRDLEELLRRIREEGSNYKEIFFLSPTGGRVLVSTDKTSENDFRIYSLYYDQGKRAPFVQNVYPSPVTLKPTLTLAAPVRGADASLLGVLAAHLSLDYLDRSILQMTGLGESGVVTLVDRHKVLVTGESYGGEVLGTDASSPAIDGVVLGESGTGLYRNLAGTPVLGVYRWIAERELGLVVEIHRQEAFAPARRLATSILVVGSLCLGLLVGGIILAARRIARPVLALTDAAARVQGGDLSTRAPATTDDEIGTLAGTFNRMVEQLARDQKERLRADELRESLIAELETKNAELERFTYTVSHDLKSPLLTITGFLGFLNQDLENGDAERVRKDIDRIATAAHKMEQLLDDLLELSRIGRVVHPPEEVPVVELARDIAEAVAAREAGRGAKIEVSPDLPEIFADRVRVQEVLENLVENALKFMGDQPVPRVEIGSRPEGEEVVLFVRDNGKGIPPAYHESIFGLFDRLDPAIEGTGVGLAIVRRIVEVHGGRIWVESEGEGRGSTFCFTFPRPPASSDSRRTLAS